jgi:hypothetical protein
VCADDLLDLGLGSRGLDLCGRLLLGEVGDLLLDQFISLVEVYSLHDHLGAFLLDSFLAHLYLLLLRVGGLLDLSLSSALEVLSLVVISFLVLFLLGVFV